MEEGILLKDRYQLFEKLGSGGMADVFRARDLMLDRIVAIKVLRKDFSGNKNFQDNFRLEARSAANLSHPNIVTVHDFGFTDDILFIVMEHIDGNDLKQLIRQRGRFTVKDGLETMVQACLGIGYAHRAGIVHCDVKPHNMLVSKDGRLKVTDFGIARALATIIPGERTDVVWGSPLYFAPEQARGEAPSPASDVYSIGIVMYELFTGTPPFTAGSPEELARLHVSARPIPIREYVPDLPRALEEIIAKVMSKEPSARYRTAEQLGRVLQKFGAQREAPGFPSRPQPSKPARLETPSSGHNSYEETPAPGFERPAPRQYAPPQPMPAPEDYYESTADVQPEPGPASAFEDIDWASAALGIGVILSVGGLLPFWMMIYFAFNP